MQRDGKIAKHSLPIVLVDKEIIGNLNFRRYEKE